MKEELLSKKEPNLKSWKILSLSILQNIREHVLKRTSGTQWPLESLWGSMGRNTASESQGMVTGWNERSLSGSSTFSEWWRCLVVKAHFSLRRGKHVPGVNSEIIRPTVLALMVQMASAQSLRVWGTAPAQLCCKGRPSSALGSEGRVSNQRLLLTVRSDGIHLAWNPSPFLLYFSLL